SLILNIKIKKLMINIKKIVVLDGYGLNPGDLDRSALEKYGQLTVFDRTNESEIVERAADADVILTNKVHVRSSVLAQLPRLAYIVVLGTGYIISGIEVAKNRGIVVTIVLRYCSSSVVQLTFALLPELSHRVQWHSDSVMGGKW